MCFFCARSVLTLCCLRPGKIESANLDTWVQILGTDAGDCCPSILVVTKSARYLFNAGDGLQVSWVRVFLVTCHSMLCVWSCAVYCQCWLVLIGSGDRRLFETPSV